MYSIAYAKNSSSHSSINPSDNFLETENLTNSQTNYFHAYASRDQCQSSFKLNNWVPNSDSNNEESFVKLDPFNLKDVLNKTMFQSILAILFILKLVKRSKFYAPKLSKSYFLLQAAIKDQKKL